jgi:hypothetical protein
MRTDYTAVTNKDGRVSAYGFNCGYYEHETHNGIKVELYKDCNTFHVRVFETWRNLQKRRVLWQTFDPDQLKQARKFYNQQLKKAQA